MGIIYKAVNLITDEVYVGATTNSLEERKKDHIYKAKLNIGHRFQEAIGTYGPEAFTWEQIDIATTIDDLAQKEIKYIEEYNSFEDGYNSDKGGGFKKTVYKYNLDGSLNSTFESLNNAAESINVNKKAISNACWNVNHSLGDYLWSYDYVEPFIPNKDCRKKEVVQFDLDGNFLAKFISVSDASVRTAISSSGIAKCCRGERNHSGGYFWKYS